MSIEHFNYLINLEESNKKEVGENEYYYYFYKTTNKVNNKVYFGIHQTKNLNDGYLGSGIYLNKSIEKYGKSNFSRKDLFFVNSRSELVELEKKLITLELVNFMLSNHLGYNLTSGGFAGFWINGIHITHIRIANGTHNLLKREDGSSVSSDLVDKRIHHFLKKEDGSSVGGDNCLSRIKTGKHQWLMINRKYIECPYCLGKFDSGNYEQAHGERCNLNPNKPSEEVYCYHCKKQFNSIKGLFDHVSLYCYENPNSDINTKKFECSFCHSTFTTKTGLTQHESLCEINPNKKIFDLVKCSYCGFEAHHSIGFFASHNEYCKLNPNKELKQCSCGFETKNYTQFTLHQKVCDGSNGKNYHSEITKQTIIDRTHPSFSRANCLYCKKEYSIALLGRDHGDRCLEAPDSIRVERTKKEKITCEHCGKTIAKTVYGTFHGNKCLKAPDEIREKRNIKKITCPNCSKEFNPANFAKHKLLCQ